MIDDRTAHDLVIRFGTSRLCLWRLCRRAACRRARLCRGDAQNCMDRLRDWLEAIDEEKRVRASFAPLECEIKMPAEARAYFAWRKALPAETRDRGYPKTEQEADRLRYDLARRLTNLAGEREREEALRKAREEKLIVGEGERGEEKNY